MKIEKMLIVSAIVCNFAGNAQADPADGYEYEWQGLWTNVGGEEDYYRLDLDGFITGLEVDYGGSTNKSSVSYSVNNNGQLILKSFDGRRIGTFSLEENGTVMRGTYTYDGEAHGKVFLRRQ